MPYLSMFAVVTRRAGTPMLMALVAATSLVTVNAGAQQSRTPPTPPTPATAPTPASAPAPAAAPKAPSSSSWRYDVERAAAMSGQFMDLEALKFDAMNAARLAAPRALESMNVQAMMLDAQQAALAGQKIAAEASVYSLNAVKAAAVAGVDAYAYSVGQAPLAMSFGGSSFRTQAPASWKADDPADSLYREARKALSNDNYPIAAMLFRRIRDQFPKSTYAPDSYYWEAFAMQRVGQRASLNGALDLLAQQQEKYPKASTRGDANSLRTRIEGQLARMGDEQAIARLADRARNATSDGCPRAQDDERVDALNAVAQMDAELALPILKKTLARREPCTQQLRRTAVWLVASRRVPDAASILLNVAKTDPDKEVREQAVYWMSNVPTEETTTMLIDLAKKGDDLDLRKRAVYALSRSKSPRAVTTLKEIILDANADGDLRADALNWYISGPGRTADDSFAFLKDVYGRADDTRFKQRVMQSLASRRTEESRTFLVDVAQNAKESMEVRRSAIWSLQGSGVTNAQLATIYDRGTDTEIRKQVIGVLAGLKDNGGVDKLIDIVRNEKNVELRKQALNSLSRSKDPRVIALYAEIIDR